MACSRQRKATLSAAAQLQALGRNIKTDMDAEERRGRLAADLRTFEAELGLPDEFLDRLLGEDDWSFVIKAHALIEATVTHRLTEDVDVRLRKVFERLELSNTEHGKLVFAESLGFVGSTERRFIRLLSELRNKLVHDIRRVTFTFAAYLESLDKKQRASFVDTVAAFFEPTMDKEHSRNMVLGNPRLAI